LILRRSARLWVRKCAAERRRKRAIWDLNCVDLTSLD
jgi:hypothetical protein